MRREAEQLHFPLECATIQLKAVEKAEPLPTRQPLEQEVHALLQGAKLVQEKKVCVVVFLLHADEDLDITNFSTEYNQRPCISPAPLHLLTVFCPLKSAAVSLPLLSCIIIFMLYSHIPFKRSIESKAIYVTDSSLPADHLLPHKVCHTVASLAVCYCCSNATMCRLSDHF